MKSSRSPGKGVNTSIKSAKRVLRIEAEAVKALIDRIDKEFEKTVDLIYSCKGKVVLTGIGKSGLICQKIASTLTSMGTPAFFLHPVEGLHGDLGVLDKRDILIAVSNSGETEEILRILPTVKRMGIKLITLCGNPRSTLALSSDLVLNISVKEEACSLGLAPTASTTATLALGDALAVALLERRGFREEEFALIHPGGILGKRLLLRVEDLMHTGSEIPWVKENTRMKDVLMEITTKRLGVTGVSNGKGELVGVITDGDLRRALEKYDDIMERKAKDIMTKNPKRIEKNTLAARALHLMERHAITSLFIYQNDKIKKAIGIVHLHDILGRGILGEP
ncbi:MAG: KpsF/GutQ family sugar-phosphate isomerase [Deltaproteobacteria bacterium]|nr:MAG: KpsF/GutQ family sugar-phosphate isomerase [Deltaproteobacteria bacterium]